MTFQPARDHLLTSVQMAHFVSHGSLIMEAVVPEELNAQAIDVFREGIPPVPYGTSVEDSFPEGSFARRLVEVPRIAGALHSLVGPGPTIDHHAVHLRRPNDGQAQPLHGDAIIDVRLDAFDVQLMYYPQDVTLEMGGTLSVPGSHLRRTNESDTGRYQNLRGQTRLTCPAGTVVLVHHGIWHGGRRNDSDIERFMFKIRFNPTVRQLRLWNTDDIDKPEVSEKLRSRFPWYEHATGRLEIYNRVQMWRALTGDDTFDIDYWSTRVSNRPQRVVATAGR
ncbi:Phytanoyl-CoA dioxygenase (PhyH) [Actinopolymorpha cephalotaxi]|nr:phytanoyl-CoA dioxygenase family protein [Actinopolymorpha cephalotaxi]SFH24198.1 Phytanoyl-CoA dioxygenase (PhyH) [Actinopolymorpha cephalotaxi]